MEPDIQVESEAEGDSGPESEPGTSSESAPESIADESDTDHDSSDLDAQNSGENEIYCSNDGR